MILKYTYNTKYSIKDNVLLYLKLNKDVWLSPPRIENDMRDIKHNTLYPILSIAFKDELIKRKHTYGAYEYKINQPGIEYLNQLVPETKKNVKPSIEKDDFGTNNKCDNKTLGYQKKIDRKDIINYLNTLNSWADSATVANILGFNSRTHSGAIGHILSTMYEDGIILRKIEKSGARFYAHIDYVGDSDGVLSNELIETKDTDTIENSVQNDTNSTEKPPQDGQYYTVVPKIPSQPSDYILMFKGRMKCLESNGVSQSAIAKMCFEALQSEYDSIVAKKKMEILENKRTDEMKYMEDHNFVFLEDQKKLQNEILDLKDRLNKKDSKESNDRAMSEHMVKIGTIK